MAWFDRRIVYLEDFICPPASNYPQVKKISSFKVQSELKLLEAYSIVLTHSKWMSTGLGGVAVILLSLRVRSFQGAPKYSPLGENIVR